MSNPRGHVATIQPPPNPVKPGETRALSHGATSERALQPLREGHARELRQDFPWLDGRRVALVADLLARIDKASEFVARADGHLINRKGRKVTPIADSLDRWEARAMTFLREIHAEAREHGRNADPLAEHLRANYGTEEGK